MKFSSTRGFAPIFLLVIFALVGIVVVAAPAVLEKAKDDTPSPTQEGIDKEKIMRAAVSSGNAAELKKLGVALEVYSTEHEGQYPPAPAICGPVTTLEQYLSPMYIEKFPAGAYDVAVSADRSRFVLRTLIDADNETLLTTAPGKVDKDGTILGCACDDPYFCITSYEEDPERLRQMEDGTLPPPPGAKLSPEAERHMKEMTD